MSAWKMQMWHSYSSKISTLIEAALSGRKLSCSYGKAIELSRQLVISGAWFLRTGDVLDGQAAMNRIDSLIELNLADLADLCGMLATLIAAGVGRRFEQGGISGRALIVKYNVKREQLKLVWLIACPRAAVVSIRKAA